MKNKGKNKNRQNIVILVIGTLALLFILYQMGYLKAGSCNEADVNKDGFVNQADQDLITTNYGKCGTNIGDQRADIDGSGCCDLTDLRIVAGWMDSVCVVTPTITTTTNIRGASCVYDLDCFRRTYSTTYCNAEGDVVRDFIDPLCVNPGTSSSYCSSRPQETEVYLDCPSTCLNGECVIASTTTTIPQSTTTTTQAPPHPKDQSMFYAFVVIIIAGVVFMAMKQK